MVLLTKRLKLREPDLRDIPAIHQLLTLPETSEYNTAAIPVNIVETQIKIEGWITANRESKREKFIFCIDDLAGNVLGLIGINSGKPGYKSAEVWFQLHRDHWNKGFATEALERILDFCFEELKLHRVNAGCATGNIASKKVLEKCGMIFEGNCREILPVKGQWLDNYEFAILESDHKKRKIK